MKKFNFDIVAEKYDEFYKTDLGKQIDIAEKRAVKSLLDGVPRAISLEVGCGTGHWTQLFRIMGFPLVAIDVSAKMLEIAQKKNISGTVFLNADVEQMPFRDNYFSNVFTITTLEFVKNLDKAVSEINRVLRPGGYFLIGALNGASQYVQQQMKKGGTLSYARPFTPDTLRNLLLVFGEPIIKGAAYVKDGQVLDNVMDLDQKELLYNGAFLCGIVQKIR